MTNQQADLINLRDLNIRAGQSEFLMWQGRKALHLENGLALVPDLRRDEATIEVLVGVDGPAYPGIAFRVSDVLNYELAYAVPHVSGQWDALQYDPVFHGSNTWQLFHGPGFQQSAQVPTGRWFAMRLAFCGPRAAVWVDEQPPLLVEQTAHEGSAGLLGLWTFQPAYFSALRVSPSTGLELAAGGRPSPSNGSVQEWFLEGYGVVRPEPHGMLNLNRYLPTAVGEAKLIRRFEMLEGGAVTMEFGFSDALVLELDEQPVFNGENTFQGFADRASRGYATLGDQSLEVRIEPGMHSLAARLRATEPFGWGLVFAAHADHLRWLPPELG